MSKLTQQECQPSTSGNPDVNESVRYNPVISDVSEDESSERTVLCNRFYPSVSNEDILRIAKGNVPKTTEAKLKWAENLYNDWRLNRNAHTMNQRSSGECIISGHLTDYKNSPQDLNYVLTRFFREVKKVNGEDYHASTIWDLLMDFQIILNRNKPEKPIKFLKDPEFQMIRDIVDVTMKERSKEGLGRRRHADTISVDQENTLWESEILGQDNPTKLYTTVLYVLGVNFALRGGDYYRSLRPDNFEFGQDENGEYLLYKENVSKCHQGGISSRQITPKAVRAYANTKQQARCPVKLFRKFLSVRPEFPAALFLRPKKKYSDDLWYENTPIGKNTLNNVVRDLCRKAGFSGI